MSFAKYIFEATQAATAGLEAPTIGKQLAKQGISFAKTAEAEIFVHKLLREGLYLDIETAGKEQTDQILSIAFSRGLTSAGNTPTSLFAKYADDPNNLDPWVRQVVWPKIKQEQALP